MHSFLLQSEEAPELPESELTKEERESYSFTEDVVVKLKEVHGTIRAYARYAIGAFKNLGAAEVEELNLEFGVKIEKKTGLPVLTGVSASADFEIQVKCKFPDNQK